MDSGKVNIRGKEYLTVAKRVADFRADHEFWSIESEILTSADVVQVRSTIKDDQSRVLAIGHAEEVRDSSNINKTSALENCETSAVGRALAFLGYGGSEIASANEVSDAVIAGAKKEVSEFFIQYNKCVFENYHLIEEIQDCMDREDLITAVGLWYENLSEEEQNMIYKLAPTKGGILTTKQREQMKSTEWAEAYRNFLGE